MFVDEVSRNFDAVVAREDLDPDSDDGRKTLDVRKGAGENEQRREAEAGDSGEALA